MSSSAQLMGCHCHAPAGLFLHSHSYLKSNSRYPISHFIGFVVHGPSIPLVIVSTPIPDAYLFFQPKPIISIGEPSGSASTSASSPAPCALPKV